MGIDPNSCRPGFRTIRPAAFCYFFTSGHSLSYSGLAASSGAIVAICL